MSDDRAREASAADTPYGPDSYPVTGFPPQAWAWFTSACERLGIPLPDQHRDRLAALYSHLIGVNEWMNLTRLTHPLEYLKFHVLDSLTALGPVSELTVAGDLCLDLGSGGGYPGLPLMTWLPDRRWLLVDSRRKKVRFLAEAVALTGCPAADSRAFRGREAASAAPDLMGSCKMVLARAVGRGDKLVDECCGLLQMNGFVLMLKGPSYDEVERAAVAAACSRNGMEIVGEDSLRLEPADPVRTIVLLAKTEDRPAGPRPGRRRRKKRS